MKATRSVPISRSDIVQLLKAWQRDDVTAAEVQAWAEGIYIPGTFEVDDYEGGDSVCAEVLQHLDCLDMNLVIQEDIPLLLEFLSTPKGQFSLGFERWDRMTKSIDYRQRMKLLRGIAPYSPFCK